MTPEKPPSSPPVRVVIVDREPFTREGLTSRLNTEADIDVVAAAATIDEALAHVRDLAPDVVVVEAELGQGADGDLSGEIQAQSPTTRCVLHTTTSNPITDANTTAGAVVLKQLFGDDLAKTIRKLANEQR